MRDPCVTLASAGALAASLAAGLAGAGQTSVPAGPVPVRLERSGGAWRLLRAGEPYFVKGAGGSGSLEQLRAAGANSVRLWDAEGSDAVLDEAARRGMSVALGIWLGQPRQGFRYDDAAQVARQRERVRALVTRYREHPAVLVWGLGNEMEGDGADPAVWRAVEDLAALVKRLDAAHPVMTVIAEVGGEKVRNLHRLCPSVDIVGINSYAGAPSLPRRYAAAGGTKPYLLTEFGPPGTWEVAKTPWSAVLEPTSTEKAASYRRSYEGAVIGQPLCLGSYAFLWGNKQEGTATWFGMLLADGEKVAAVDTMTELWSGRPPANRCPVIRLLRLEGPAERDGGAPVRAALEASDPDGDPLLARWELRAEGSYGAGGDPERVPPEVRGAVMRGDARGVEARLPAEPGAFRLFVTVRDGKGGAATANVPLLARAGGAGQGPAAPRAKPP